MQVFPPLSSFGICVLYGNSTFDNDLHWTLVLLTMIHYLCADVIREDDRLHDAD